MNTKRWALLFVCLVSVDHVRSAVEAPLSNLIPGPNPRRQKRQTTGCEVVDCAKVTVLVDETLERCRARIQDSYELRDETVQDIQLGGGTASGFKNFKRVGDVQCSCTTETLIFFCEISYVDIVVSYTVTLLDRLLGGLLGNLGRQLSRLVGEVVNLLVRILALEIRVTMKVTQRLVAGSNCVLVEYKVSRVNDIQLLTLSLRGLAQSLEGVLAPVLDIVLQLVVNGQVREIFADEFGQMSVPLDVVRL